MGDGMGVSWYNLPCAFGGGRRWEHGDALQQSQPHLPSSCVVSFLALNLAKDQGSGSLNGSVIAPAPHHDSSYSTVHTKG